MGVEWEHRELWWLTALLVPTCTRHSAHGAPRRREVKHIWAEGGYTGTLVAWAKHTWRCTVEIVKRTELHTFKVLPRRWVVERTFGWLGRYRRLSRDYERNTCTAETMVPVAMIRLMLARLARHG